jgi:osmoprotectant transport system permease protein
LTNNQIDFYPEYTGTGLLVILHPDSDDLAKALASPETALDYVDKEFQQQYSLKWLKPLGFSNSYALMMRSEEAKEFGIQNISQLSAYVRSN